MSSITNYYANANQNHTELLLTPVRMAIVKRTKDKCWSGLERLEGLYRVGRKVKCMSLDLSMENISLIKKDKNIFK